MSKKPLAPAASIYTLKISLREIKPAIWRIVEVRGDTTLATLHRVIQAAMGWQDYHLHLFQVGALNFGVPSDEDFGERTLDERKVTVSALLSKAGNKLIYTYDFGDDWEHEVKLEKVTAPVSRTRYRRCIGGSRACPPEDSHGPYGYMQMLEALRDPKHEEHEQWAEWAPKDFDPEAFNLKVTDGEVSRAR